MNVVAIIAAAGKGKRLSLPYNKVFYPLNALPLLFYSLRSFENCNMVNSIYLMVSKEDINLINIPSVKKKITKLKEINEGGEERQDTVRKALRRIKNADIVLIHDGARPFIEEKEIEKCIKSALKYKASVLGVPLKDTVKISDSKMNIISTPDRKRLWQIQTPQCFDFKLLKEAYRQAEKEKVRATDDSSLVERLGVKVKIVRGTYRNIKITTKEDILIAEAFLNKGSQKKGLKTL